jgi:hypothetical protein
VRCVFGGSTTDLTHGILDNLFPGQVNAALDATVVDKPTKETDPRRGLVAPNKDSLSTAHPLATAHDTVEAPCVQIWKRRNVVVFRGERSPLAATMLLCRSEVGFWRSRLRREDHHIVAVWCRVLHVM